MDGLAVGIGAKMPKGPKGEKRPADAVGAAVMVAKIATGEIEEAEKKRQPKKRALKPKLARQRRDA